MPDLNSLIQENTAFQIAFNLFGGTALLMYGVDFMGGGLEKASGKVMKKILSVLTKNLYVAFFVGTILTMLVQSSTAITVMTVGFVNAGLHSLFSLHCCWCSAQHCIFLWMIYCLLQFFLQDRSRTGILHL
jgi:hypothetical protein